MKLAGITPGTSHQRRLSTTRKRVIVGLEIDHLLKNATLQILAILMTLCLPSIAHGQSAPYPQSTVITGWDVDFDSRIKVAVGSDNFPVTWGDDNKQYTSWGDGCGFISTDCKFGSLRFKWGVSSITGAVDDFVGQNLASGNVSPPGKSYGMVSVGGVLYQWFGPGSCNEFFDYTQLAMSTDHGTTWSIASWDFKRSDSIFNPGILNFGKDYAGARDNYVYHYFIADGGACTITIPGNIVLARVPRDDVMLKGAYEFFSGTASAPSWSTELTDAQPVFHDPAGVGWTISVSYNPVVKRYLLITDHGPANQLGTGRAGLFDAPEPWGPWTTVDYWDDWGGYNGEFFYYNFSNKWTSEYGLPEDFVIISTGCCDTANEWAMNIHKGRFILGTGTGTDTTPPNAPQNVRLSPGTQ